MFDSFDAAPRQVGDGAGGEKPLRLRAPMEPRESRRRGGALAFLARELRRDHFGVIQRCDDVPVAGQVSAEKRGGAAAAAGMMRVQDQRKGSRLCRRIADGRLAMFPMGVWNTSWVSAARSARACCAAAGYQISHGNTRPRDASRASMVRTPTGKPPRTKGSYAPVMASVDHHRAGKTAAVITGRCTCPPGAGAVRAMTSAETAAARLPRGRSHSSLRRRGHRSTMRMAPVQTRRHLSGAIGRRGEVRPVRRFSRHATIQGLSDLRRGGGTGRRTGLKILGPARGVRVRVPPPAINFGRKLRRLDSAVNGSL